MTILRGRRKRNRAIIAILLPAIIFLWIVGWSLYWISLQEKPRKAQPPSSPKEDHVSLMAIVLEEPSEIES
ncbi:hypothetical protein MUO79_01950 [Candidatus Bathyarchaeota archaeon]|nr:hypothetical protein [Candidatus Bathyarchaeota archaeon]